MEKKEEKLYFELVDVLKTYMTEDELKQINKAYEYALEKHEGQLRRTGESYITHPLSCSIILTTIFADCPTIIATLLHDTLEDTTSTKEEIENLFGKEVTNLVDGVTKINSINISTQNEYLTSYYKKIIVGMSEDVRVIIIKLADRLHNMRTLYALPKEKQVKKAKETLEILTPIAHRLGMHKIKSELEDLSLKYLKPEVYFDIVEKLNNNKVERENYVEEMMQEVSKILDQNKIKHEIKGRAKSIYSIYKKLDKGKPFNEIYDLLAIRIIVEKEQDCYQVLGIIHSKYKPLSKRFKDYIAMPKTNLYQTLHTTVFGLNGNLFEIQIRTHEMDEIAENGIASHWAYKEHKNAAMEMQNITEQKLQFYKSIIELNEEKMTNEEFVNSVKNEVLNNNIYVYTPKGDVIELPVGATPIDFAYRVHSQVGDKMTGAYVNDNMVSLTYILKTGDIVKIITNKNSIGPSREWIKLCKTTQAKNKIKSFFNKTSKEDYINLGKDLLEKELRRKKLSIIEFMKQENINKILSLYKLKSLNDLYFDIGSNKFSAKSIVKYDQPDTKIDIKKEFTKLFEKSKDNDIIVGDTKNVKTRIASCCYPVPGDEIVGYITKTSGISIHRTTCLNINHEDERIISANWNKNTKNKYYSEIIIYSNSKKNIFSDIVQIAANLGITIENMNIINKTDNIIYSVILYLNNLDELNKCITAFSKIKYISNIERVI